MRRVTSRALDQSPIARLSGPLLQLSVTPVKTVHCGPIIAHATGQVSGGPVVTYATGSERVVQLLHKQLNQ